MLRNILAITLLFCMSTFALAESGSANKVHAGIKLGSSISGIDDLDNDISYGIQLGFNFTDNFSAEFEYMIANLEGPFNIGLDTKTFGVYGTYRSPGQAYFLGKIGFINLEASVEAEELSVSESDTGLSYGIGGGYNFTDSLAVELEYTLLDQDLSVLVAVARFKF